MRIFGELHRRGEIVFEELVEFLDTRLRRLDTKLGKLLLEGGIFQRLLCHVVQFCNNIARSLGWRRNSVPCGLVPD